MARVPIPEEAAAADGAPNLQDAPPNAGDAARIMPAAPGVAPNGARNAVNGGAGRAGNAPYGAPGGAPMPVAAPAFQMADIETVLREGPALQKSQGPGSLILF